MGAAFQAFLAGAPFALIVVMGVPPEQLGYFIMAVPIGYIIGNFISSRMSQRASRRRMIWIGGLPGGGWVRRCWCCCRSRSGLTLYPDPSARLLFLWVRLSGAQQSGRGADRRGAGRRRIRSRAGRVPPDGGRVRQHRRHGVSGPDILPAGGPGDVLVLHVAVPAGLRAAGGARAAAATD